MPRPRRDGLGLPRARPQRLRPLGRAEGAAEHGRRRRDGRRARRAPLPRRGRAPEHREDLQLRPARALGLHRHGVRRRAEPEGAAHDARRQRRHAGAAAAGAGDRLHARGPPRARAPAPLRAAVLRLQARQRHPDAGLAEAHRPRRRLSHRRPGRPGLRHRGLPGPGDRGDGPVGGVRPLHGRAHADDAVHRLRRATRAPSPTACRPRSRCRSSSSSTRSTASSRRARRPTPTTASRRRRRWPISSSASCARSSRATAAPPSRGPARCSAATSARVPTGRTTGACRSCASTATTRPPATSQRSRRPPRPTSRASCAARPTRRSRCGCGSPAS